MWLLTVGRRLALRASLRSFVLLWAGVRATGDGLKGEQDAGVLVGEVTWAFIDLRSLSSLCLHFVAFL